MRNQIFAFNADPYIGFLLILVFTILAILIGLIAFKFYRRSVLLRLIIIAVFMFVFINPSLYEERRETVKNVAAIILDQSFSQSFENRMEVSNNALSYLRERLGKIENLDVRIAQIPNIRQPDIYEHSEKPSEDPPDHKAAKFQKDTRIFDDLESIMADVPKDRRAGVFVISDGRIHDVPKNTDTLDVGPVHLLLSGRKNEKDRHIVLIEAPAYGITGQTIDLRLRLVDTPNIGAHYAGLTLTDSQGNVRRERVRVNENVSFTLPIAHAGQNVYQIEAETEQGELTDLNNKTGFIVNGVRDRLKVLLVSGRPHAGGRQWRDLLKSDPGVDLVHFTILRDPSKYDPTPKDDMSLIAFPFRELFEVKLYDFDLIIFDRYSVFGILPPQYFENIARYVREGGGFLAAAGPEFAGNDLIYYTALGGVIPAQPTGDVIDAPYVPALSVTGMRHPVTRDLAESFIANNHQNNLPDWGAWLRHIKITPKNGSDVLMTGADQSPLMVMDRIENGRVALIASDHLSLWARGYDGGGPHAAFLKRLIHWLMKDPALDEEAIALSVLGYNITARLYAVDGNMPEVRVTLPDQSTQVLDIKERENGLYEHVFNAPFPGVYTFEILDGASSKSSRAAVVGSLNAPEINGITVTNSLMQPVLDKSQGGVIWLSDTPTPSIRMMQKSNGSYAGDTWLGLKRNQAFRVEGMEKTPLMHEWLALLLLGGFIVFSWLTESRS